MEVSSSSEDRTQNEFMGIFKKFNVAYPLSRQEQNDPAARGWTEGFMETQFRDERFMLQHTQHETYLIFGIVETHERDGTTREPYPFWSPIRKEPSKAQSIGWNEFDWVRLRDRKSYPDEMQDFHWEVIESSTDPQLISGHVQLGNGDESFFSLIGDEQKSSRNGLISFGVLE
jgi:hypothetical protein